MGYDYSHSNIKRRISRICACKTWDVGAAIKWYHFECLYIFTIAYLLVPKIKDCAKRDYILFGVMWFGLTNLFDLSSYIKSGAGFARLLQSYNIFTGNTWLLVVLSALLSPMLVMKMKEKR